MSFPPPDASRAESTSRPARDAQQIDYGIPTDLGALDLTGISWVIVGGESGPGARPMHPSWARSIRDQCVAAGVPFFFKQWGQWAPDDRYNEPVRAVRAGASRPDALMVRLRRKADAGRVLDGRTWDEMPGYGGTA